MPKHRLVLDPVAYETGYDDALRDAIRELRALELDHPDDKLLTIARRLLIGLIDGDNFRKRERNE